MPRDDRPARAVVDLVAARFDPLRAAILGGRDVIVHGVPQGVPGSQGAEAMAAAREAATVAGRLAEMRVVRDGAGSGPEPVRCAREGVGILVVETLPGKDGMAAVRQAYGHLGAWREATGRTPCLFVELGRAVPGPPFLGVPLRASEPESLHVRGLRTRWRAHQPGADDGFAGRGDWASAVAGMAWAGEGRLAVHGTVACVRDASRAVLVRRPADGPSGRAYDVFEVDPDGWCSGWQCGAQDWAGLGIADVAWLGWCAGAGALGMGMAGGWNARMHDPAHRLGAEARATALDVEAADLLAGIADLPLLAAVEAQPDGRHILQAVRAEGGDARARRDYAIAFPAFSAYLREPDFAAHVDSGAQTVPLVADRLGVSRAVARRLVGLKDLPDCMKPWSGEPDDLAWLMPDEFLGAIGHDRLPMAGDADGWDALDWCGDCLREVLFRADVSNPDPRACADLLLRCGPDWPARKAAILRASDGDGSFGTVAPAEAGDFARAFADWLGRVSGRPVDPMRSLSLLAGEGSLAGLLGRSERWHRDPRLLQGDGIPDTVTWPVPFGRVDLGDGWHAVCLDGVGALRDEGGDGPDASGMDGMDHCVGRYGRECWSGQSLIVSFRLEKDGATRRMLTLELVRGGTGLFDIGGHPYGMRQFRRRSNGSPTIWDHAPMERLRGMLAEGEVPVDAGALVSRTGDPPGIDRREGALALLDAWRALLPRALAGLDADTLGSLASGRIAGATARVA